MDDMMLIVDDLDMNRAILKVLFEKKYEIIEAETGEEALEILERCQGSIDIVLLDLVMPGISGFDIMEKRKELEYFENIPVVVITGSNAMEDQIRAFELGANDFISKPFIPEIVVSRVDNVMASNRRMLSIEVEAQKMKIKSELDEMTGIYNKSTTEEAMDSVLKMSSNRMQAMMIIANLISSLFRKTDIVGRIGGDEFCVMMVDVPKMDIVYNKVNELIQVMRYKPNLAIPEYVTLSIGLAHNENKSSSYAELFKKADEALYMAKKGGKAQYREYGVEKVNMEIDDRTAALLLSNNRSVCSMVHSLLPVQIRIIEVLNVDELGVLTEEDIEKIKLIYIDISDIQADSDIWGQLKAYEWIDYSKIIAVYQESDMKQCLAALQNGVADMISTPIDAEAFKRKTGKQIEKFHILDSEDE